MVRSICIGLIALLGMGCAGKNRASFVLSDEFQPYASARFLHSSAPPALTMDTQTAAVLLQFVAVSSSDLVETASAREQDNYVSESIDAWIQVEEAGPAGDPTLIDLDAPLNTAPNSLDGAALRSLVLDPTVFPDGMWAHRSSDAPLIDPTIPEPNLIGLLAALPLLLRRR